MGPLRFGDRGHGAGMRGEDAGAPTASAGAIDLDRFYMRYYVGHKGRYGHEFLELEVVSSGRGHHLRYANQSNYRAGREGDRGGRDENIIRKECDLSRQVVAELARVIQDSEIVLEDDGGWPEADRNGMQALEVVLNDAHIHFETTKIGSLLDVQKAEDPEGLRVFYYLVQDIKCFVFSLISLHFKIKPI